MQAGSLGRDAFSKIALTIAKTPIQQAIAQVIVWTILLTLALLTLLS